MNNELIRVWLKNSIRLVVTHDEFIKLLVSNKVKTYEIVHPEWNV
jgi:hypothetical protein